MPEDQNTEWKQRWKDDYLATLCGLANAQGGKLYIGLDDEGQAVGVDNATELLAELPLKTRNSLGIIVGVDVEMHQTAQVVCVTVPKYHNLISLHGHFYLRSGSTTQELTGEALTNAILLREGRQWDALPAPYARADELSKLAIERFLELGIACGRIPTEAKLMSREQLLRNLHLIDNASNQLTNAAILLFHPAPEQLYPGAAVKLGRFTGTEQALLHQDVVTGPLATLDERVYETLRLKYITEKVTFEGALRREQAPIPREALREAIHNALAHRDYASPTPTQIAVADTHIAIANPGGLPHNWTVDTLRGPHYSEPRNAIIAQAYFCEGLIESWGSGLRRLGCALKEAHLLPPDIQVNSGIMLTMYSEPNEQLLRAGVTDERLLRIMELALTQAHVDNADVQQLLGVSRSVAYRLLQKLLPWLLPQQAKGKNAYYAVGGYPQ